MNSYNCPICGSEVELLQLPEENEIINCNSCNNRLLAKIINEEGVNKIILTEAPAIEEDWGE